MNVGREGGPMAMSHTENFPFFGRSAFLVFIRVPGERADTLNFVQVMNSLRRPELPPGTEVALARLMLHINQEGKITSTPIVESVQIRHFTTSISQKFYAFKLDREGLFAAEGGGLRAVEKEFPLFFSHGVDWFEFGVLEETHVPEIPSLCNSCHQETFRGILGAQSILSYSRARFPLLDEVLPVLSETTREREAKLVMAWKVEHRTWRQLKRLWHWLIASL